MSKLAPGAGGERVKVPTPTDLLARLEKSEWLDAGERNPVTGPMRLIEPGLYKQIRGTLRAMQAQTEHEPLTTAEIRTAGQRAGMMMAAALLDERGWLKDAANLIREEANKHRCNCGAGNSFHDLSCPMAVPELEETNSAATPTNVTSGPSQEGAGGPAADPPPPEDALLHADDCPVNMRPYIGTCECHVAHISALKRALAAAEARAQVPREPTDEMIFATHSVIGRGRKEPILACWRAMYDAALARPEPDGNDG